MAYRRKHGPVATGPRLEMHLASVQAMIAQALGGKARPEDFLMASANTPRETGIDWEQAISAFETMGAIDGQ